MSRWLHPRALLKRERRSRTSAPCDLPRYPTLSKILKGEEVSSSFCVAWEEFQIKCTCSCDLNAAGEDSRVSRSDYVSTFPLNFPHHLKQHSWSTPRGHCDCERHLENSSKSNHFSLSHLRVSTNQLSSFRFIDVSIFKPREY